jgi:predicted alpha/beta-fold hydrolase
VSDFDAPWWLRNPHAQTVWGRIARPRRLVQTRRESVTTPDGDELLLDHLDGSGPHFVLMHGLEGSSNSVYMQGVMSVIARHGHSATAINFRSCARHPRSVFRELPNRRPRFYHSGETGDFDFVVRRLNRPLLAFGASLGGNVLLKWLGENPSQTWVRAAATISTPYDLGAGARHLETGAGPFYVARFLRSLKKKVTRVKAEFPDARVDLEAALRSKTFREFDDAATAPLHGFRDAEDYYTSSSSIRFLHAIRVPTLCLNAVDDPFLPPEVLERAKSVASPSVEFITTSSGGHVGFVAGAPWRARYWAEELVVQWLLRCAA